MFRKRYNTYASCVLDRLRIEIQLRTPRDNNSTSAVVYSMVDFIMVMLPAVDRSVRSRNLQFIHILAQKK